MTVDDIIDNYIPLLSGMDCNEAVLLSVLKLPRKTINKKLDGMGWIFDKGKKRKSLYVYTFRRIKETRHPIDVSFEL